MNIFFTSYNPHECAHHLDDKRLNKMIVETAQLLSTAARSYLHPFNCDSYKLYKSTHFNHPCAIWVRANPRNYYHTWHLLSAYLQEYQLRFGKRHATADIWDALHKVKGLMWPDLGGGPIGGCDEPPHCFHPLVDRNLPATTGYQQTLRLKWLNDIREPKWTNREKPCFADVCAG